MVGEVEIGSNGPFTNFGALGIRLTLLPCLPAAAMVAPQTLAVAGNLRPAGVHTSTKGKVIFLLAIVHHKQNEVVVDQKHQADCGLQRGNGPSSDWGTP